MIATTFAEVLEAADQLTFEEQENLINILRYLSGKRKPRRFKERMKLRRRIYSPVSLLIDFSTKIDKFIFFCYCQRRGGI